MTRCPSLDELPPPPLGKTGWPWAEESPRLPDAMPDGRRWPKISIVTAALNQGPYIEETIRSILLQGYPDVEHIVVDGRDGEDPGRYGKWLHTTHRTDVLRLEELIAHGGSISTAMSSSCAASTRCCRRRA